MHVCNSLGRFDVGIVGAGIPILHSGLSLTALDALPASERQARVEAARQKLLAAGADLAIASVADLWPALAGGEAQLAAMKSR